MENTSGAKRKKKVLLTAVFGPYGVDDKYGRKENIMELFHNQVTKAQGLASLRFHHRSFGLYFLAANLDADVTVLDFPSQKKFIKELGKGYDVVGISFIAPNFVKAREMARLTRLHSPKAEIVLGGHGTAIENLEELIDCDHVARGEGIQWMRDYLGQNPNAPVKHPALPSTERQSIFGVRVPGTTSNLLIPGVGCVNGCNFCCTSHFFDKTYTPFIRSGRQLFETARQIADSRGTDSFFVMDENFLKDHERAMDLLDEMEKHKRFFNFHIFSSAEAITAFGVDNLLRLGAQFVWIGFESQSQQDGFAKNRGINPKELVDSIRARGVSVLASGILCMEHHTPENIHRDIDFLVGLEADMVQFMLLTPMPVTGLYKNHKARGILRDDIPFEDIHGQKVLNFKHPAFAPEEPAQLLDQAFRKDYEVNSSSIYRIIETTFRGYRHISERTDLDDCLRFRKEQAERRLRGYSILLPTIARYAVNPTERARAIRLENSIAEYLGKPNLLEKAGRVAAQVLATSWKIRTKLRGDMLQPSTIVTRFKASELLEDKAPMPLVSLGTSFLEEVSCPRAAAMANTGDSA